MTKRHKNTFKYCTACKSPKACKCKGRGRYTAQELVLKHYKEGQTPSEVLRRINDIGYPVSKSVVFTVMDDFQLTKRYEGVRERKDVTDFVNELTEKPTEEHVMKQRKCTRYCAKNAIHAKFGKKERKERLNKGEQEYLDECLKTYNNWLEKKTFQMPPNVVMAEGLLKRHKMI